MPLEAENHSELEFIDQQHSESMECSSGYNLGREGGGASLVLVARGLLDEVLEARNGLFDRLNLWSSYQSQYKC